MSTIQWGLEVRGVVAFMSDDRDYIETQQADYPGSRIVCRTVTTSNWNYTRKETS